MHGACRDPDRLGPGISRKRMSEIDLEVGTGCRADSYGVLPPFSNEYSSKQPNQQENCTISLIPWAMKLENSASA
jgi:hypothetical protein